MKKIIALLIMLLCTGVNAYAANGDLTVNGTINAGSGGVTFRDGTVQKTAAFQVLSSDVAYPGTNEFNITILPYAGKINLSYKIIPSSDAEPIMLGFNDNLSSTGTYGLYGITNMLSALAGKVHAGYGRTISGSSGQHNSFDIIPSGNLIIYSGEHQSENNFSYSNPFFKGYLKYDSEQTITKINLKCYNPGTTISKIEWKVVALP